MSEDHEEWKRTHCRQISDLEICIYDHGGADINWILGDDADSLFVIPREDRPAVALALLGKPDVEDFERVAAAMWRFSHTLFGPDWTPTERHLLMNYALIAYREILGFEP